MNIKQTIVAGVLSIFALQNLSAMEPNIQYVPEVFVYVINKTASNYHVFTEKGTSAIVKTGQTKKLNLSKDWQDMGEVPRFFSKQIKMYVNDNQENQLLKFDLVLYPVQGEAGIILEAKNRPSKSFELLYRTHQKKTDFVINLYLKGNNLEESEAESTSIVKESK